MEVYIFGRRRLDGGGPQPTEIMAEVGRADAGLGQGGGGFPVLGPDIIGGGAVGTTVSFIDVGDDATHWEGVGQIPPQGGPQADREATQER